MIKNDEKLTHQNVMIFNKCIFDNNKYQLYILNNYILSIVRKK